MKKIIDQVTTGVAVFFTVFIVFFFILVMCTEDVYGQDNPPDAFITMEGWAYGAIDSIFHSCPINRNGRVDGYVGMEVTCEVWAVDSFSTFTPATLIGLPADSSRLEISISPPEQDSLGTYIKSTMYIHVLRRGNWHVDIEARPLLFVMAYMYNRPASATYPQLEFPNPGMNILGGPLEEFIFCAYEGGYADARMKSKMRPIPCPDLGGAPLPEFDVIWTLPEVIWSQMESDHPMMLYSEFATGEEGKPTSPMRADRKSVAVVASQ